MRRTVSRNCLFLAIVVSGCGGKAPKGVATGPVIPEAVSTNTEYVVANDPKVPEEERQKALEFFNNISGVLSIEVSAPLEDITPKLMNRKAVPSTRILSVTMESYLWEQKVERELLKTEFDRIVFHDPVIHLRGLGKVVTHKAPNGKNFTVRALLAAVVETERQTRGQSDWFDGVDVHHIFFQGIFQEKYQGALVWATSWGS